MSLAGVNKPFSEGAEGRAGVGVLRFPERPSWPLPVRMEGQQGRRGQAAPGSSYLVTSGALTGRTFFLRASIQLRRMPEVIADRVKTASFVCNREVTEALSAPSGGAAAPTCSLRPTGTHIHRCWAVRKATLCLRLLGTGGGVGEEMYCLRGSLVHILHETTSKQRQKNPCWHTGPNTHWCNPAVQVPGIRCQHWCTAAGHRETQTMKCPPLHTHRNTVSHAALAATSCCYNK